MCGTYRLNKEWETYRNGQYHQLDGPMTQGVRQEREDGLEERPSPAEGFCPLRRIPFVLVARDKRVAVVLNPPLGKVMSTSSQIHVRSLHW